MLQNDKISILYANFNTWKVKTINHSGYCILCYNKKTSPSVFLTWQKPICKIHLIDNTTTFISNIWYEIVEQKGFVPNFLVTGILRKRIIVDVEFTSTFAKSEILVLIYLSQTSLKNIKPWASMIQMQKCKEELNLFSTN